MVFIEASGLKRLLIRQTVSVEEIIGAYLLGMRVSDKAWTSNSRSSHVRDTGEDRSRPSQAVEMLSTKHVSRTSTTIAGDHQTAQSSRNKPRSEVGVLYPSQYALKIGASADCLRKKLLATPRVRFLQLAVRSSNKRANQHFGRADSSSQIVDGAMGREIAGYLSVDNHATGASSPIEHSSTGIGMASTGSKAFFLSSGSDCDSESSYKLCTHGTCRFVFWYQWMRARSFRRR